MHIWLPVIRSNTGTDVFSLRLCNALNQRGIRCTLTWFNRYFELFPWLLSNAKIPDGVDIVHSNSWNAFAFHTKKTHLVVTEHLNVHDDAYLPYKSTLQYLYHKLLIKRFEARSFEYASKVTCVSNYTAETLSNTFSLVDSIVIPTWVNTDMFNISGDSSSDTSHFNLLFVGNRSKRKGWDLVEKIMEQLGSDYKLYYTGEAREAGSPGNYNMVPLGKIISTSKLVEIYNYCDALLFPSRLEGLSQVILEAMSSGLPVITSKSSSMPEVISPNENGFLCSNDSIEDYIKVIKKLAGNRGLRVHITKNARTTIIQKYSEDIVIPQYISLYNSIQALT